MTARSRAGREESEQCRPDDQTPSTELRRLPFWRPPPTTPRGARSASTRRPSGHALRRHRRHADPAARRGWLSPVHGIKRI